MKGGKWNLLKCIILSICASAEALIGMRHMVPTILDQGSTNVTVHMGQDAKLPCLIKYLGPKKVAWRNISKPFFPLSVGKNIFDPTVSNHSVRIDQMEVNETLSEWNLVIRKAQPHHSGTYECQISANSAPRRNVTLNVLDTPLILEPRINITGPQYVNLYEPFTLVCNSTGSTRAPVEIDWFFRSDIIRTTDPKWKDRTVITRRVDMNTSPLSLISELILDYSNSEDQGRYICRSLNYEDNSIETTSLEVNVLNTNKDVSKRGNYDNEHRGDFLSMDKNGSGSTSMSSHVVGLWRSSILCWIILALVKSVIR